MQHFVLGFFMSLVVWLVTFITYRIKAWDFPLAFNTRKPILNALLWGVVGGVANLAIDIDFLIHQWLGFPYRYLHTPALILGTILTTICLVYLWRAAPDGRRVYTGFLVLVVGVSFIIHVLQDYLLNLF